MISDARERRARARALVVDAKKNAAKTATRIAPPPTSRGAAGATLHDIAPAPGGAPPKPSEGSSKRPF